MGKMREVRSKNTVPPKKAYTRLRENPFCSCLTVLTGPAWLQFKKKICIPFPGSLHLVCCFGVQVLDSLLTFCSLFYIFHTSTYPL